MAEKIEIANANTTFYSRFQMKYDTYENWVENNPKLLAGEIAIATIATGSSLDYDSIPLPQTLIKIGDGINNYKDLPFVSAKAADVYEWAKQKNISTPETVIEGYRLYDVTSSGGITTVTYRETEVKNDGSIDWIIDDNTGEPKQFGFISIVDPQDYIENVLNSYFYNGNGGQVEEFYNKEQTFSNWVS